MKNHNILLGFALLTAFAPLFAQEQQNQQQGQQQQQVQQGTIPPETPQEAANMAVIPNDPEAENVGPKKVAEENLQTLLVDDFEIPHGWQASIPLDYGISRVLFREGSPKDIATEDNKMVLGVKTVFFRRNYGWQSIDRPFPIIINSVVKNFSLWAIGRNRNHVLSLKVRDLDGNMMRIKSGTGEMRWLGWKKLFFPVLDPVVQNRPQYTRRGLDFFGIHIDFVAEDIAVAEPAYFYFDYLTATVNLAGTQVGDDMADNW